MGKDAQSSCPLVGRPTLHRPIVHRLAAQLVLEQLLLLYPRVIARVAWIGGPG